MPSPHPRRKLAVLTCMDARIEPLSLLGLEVGDAHIIRNAGGLVTDDAIRSLSASQSMLDTEEVVLLMHEDCGMHGASRDLGGFEDLEATLRDGMERLRASEKLAARDQIRGFIFDPETRVLREVNGNSSQVPEGLSPRLAAIVDALPIQPDSRVLEIGCGPGAAARAVAARLGTGHVLAIDRSAAAIAQARAASADQIASGRMDVRQVAAEHFVLQAGEPPYDLVFAVRVGALDGRHPKTGEQVLQRIALATTPGARLFIDGSEAPIPRFAST